MIEHEGEIFRISVVFLFELTLIKDRVERIVAVFMTIVIVLVINITVIVVSSAKLNLAAAINFIKVRTKVVQLLVKPAIKVLLIPLTLLLLVTTMANYNHKMNRVVFFLKIVFFR